MDRRPFDGERIAQALREFVDSSRVMADPVHTAAYGFDSSFATRLRTYPPDVVVQPVRTEEVSAVLRWCYEHDVPVYPRGAATGHTGGSLAVRGGVCVDLSRMNRIIAMDVDNLQVICEPGVVHRQLNEALARRSMFFPPDPGSSHMCTIGGMVANNSSGLRAVKYGQTRHYVLGLEVVLPGGQVIETGGAGSRALKSVSGYDLTSLFVGSEGTLGVVTRARLKVLPLPKKRSVALAAFARLELAGEAVNRVFQEGILPSAIELLDRRTLQAVKTLDPGVEIPGGAAAVLIFEADGEPAAVAETASRIAAACRDLALSVEWSDDPHRAARLWDARRLAGAAVARLRPGYTRIYAGEDICVPITAIPEALRGIEALSERHDIWVAAYGHVGDGNIHAATIIDIRDPDQVERAKRLVDDIHRLALDLGGTTTGEHGVGFVRARYMRREHGPALDVMRLLKRAIDPKNLMNPGKMALDDEPGADDGLPPASEKEGLPQRA